MRADLAQDALTMAVVLRGDLPAAVVLHTDRGTQRLSPDRRLRRQQQAAPLEWLAGPGTVRKTGYNSHLDGLKHTFSDLTAASSVAALACNVERARRWGTRVAGSAHRAGRYRSLLR